MKALKAVLFDLDGTLLDTLDDLADATNATLAHFGYPLRSREEVRRFVGNGIEMLLRRALPAGTEDARIFEALDFFRADYGKRSRNRTCPYAGIPALLASLRERGIRIGVVSNKYDKAVRELCDYYFPGLIDLPVGERAGVPKKPAPDTLSLAMEELGVHREETVYVGDSEVDVLTAKNAGIPCISVLWGLREREDIEAAGASVFVETVEELFAVLSAD